MQKYTFEQAVRELHNKAAALSPKATATHYSAREDREDSEYYSFVASKHSTVSLRRVTPDEDEFFTVNSFTVAPDDFDRLWLIKPIPIED